MMRVIIKILSILFIPLVIITVLIIIDIWYTSNYWVYDEEFLFNSLKEETGLDFSKCEVVDSKDDGGEGEKFIVYNCKEKNIDISLMKEKLKVLPFTENLRVRIYGDETRHMSGLKTVTYVENGYYYFIDNNTVKYKDLDDIHSDENLFSRGSYNFSLVIYDTDNDLLYYYEFDT